MPRAKIADMITGSAPPLNHVANHEPDGSDPIVLPGDIGSGQVIQWNGTKFIGFTTGAAAPIDHYFSHEPDGSDPIVLPEDISSSQVIQWNGTKFVGTDPPANGGHPSPISFHPSGFISKDDSYDFKCSEEGLRKNSTLDAGRFFCPVDLPHGVTVTKLTMNAYCIVTDSIVQLILYRVSTVGSAGLMANVTTDWTNGNGTIYDDSIDNAVVDNAQFCYLLYAYIVPQTAVENAILRSVKIDFT